MKNTFSTSTLFFAFLLFPSLLLAQDLSKRGLELRAHYPLKVNSTDVTGNYDSIRYGNHIFGDSSILSKGCARINDTCLIETPQIDDMNDNAFAIRVDFKMVGFGGPIVIAGKGYRYLGVASSGFGQFGIKTGSQEETIYNDVQLELNQWYTATVIHNTADLVTEVYLDDKFIAQKVQALNHPANDNIISNIDFSRGYSFNGYIRNLQVYSADLLKASDGEDLSFNRLKVFPNPATSELNIGTIITPGMGYQITDMQGRSIEKDALLHNTLAIDALQPGVYLLSIYEEETLVKRGRFVKD